LNNNEKEALQEFNRTQEDLDVLTWDWLLQNIERVKNEMMSKLQET